MRDIQKALEQTVLLLDCLRPKKINVDSILRTEDDNEYLKTKYLITVFNTKDCLVFIYMK